MMPIPSLQAPSKRRVAAFTLAEIMIATAITMLMVALLLSLTQGVIGSFSTARDRMIRQGDISFALDQLVQDLEGLVVPTSEGSQGLRWTPEDIEGAQAGWLTFLSTATDPDNSTEDDAISHQGATRAISYRLAYQNPFDAEAEGNEEFALYRSIASAKHTFENAFEDVDDLQEDYWTNPAAEPEPAPRAANPPDPATYLSGNVVRFAVRFLRADDETWTEPDQEIKIGQNQGDAENTESGAFVDGEQVPGGFLRAEVSVTVLSREGAGRLDGMGLEDAMTRYGKTSVRQTARLNMK